ncbi:MAG: branched-chain amino acid ABC transporter permease [Bacillota bacterium]
MKDFLQRVSHNSQSLLKKNKGIFYILLYIFLLSFPILSASNPYWIQVGIMAGLYVMMALGLNIMVGNAGLTCLGYAAFYAIGAYTYAILALRFGLSFWVCLPIAGLVVMVFGLLLGLPALRVKGHYLALVTIAFGLVVYQLSLNLEFLTGGANGLMNIPPPFIGGYSFNSPLDLGFIKLPFHANFYYLVLILTGLTILVVIRLSHSLLGLTWSAMREDQLAAQCYGINLTKNKLWAFAFGAVFGGVAGAFYAGMIGFIAPENFTYSHSVLILSMILLGGIDSIPGVIFGAVTLTVIPEMFRAFADYRMMFYGVIVVLILLFKNDGLIPAVSRKFTSQWGKKDEADSQAR